MADNSLLAFSDTLIAGRYSVDTSQSLPAAGGGLQAYLAHDRQMADARRVAIAVSRDASPRLRHLKIIEEPIDALMTPLGHGVAANPATKGESYFVICTPPPGPPVSAPLNVWPERALIDLVLRPAAGVLDELHQRHLTYRGIRPNNVFQAVPGQPVCLGAAWAAPPAMHQPSVFEPPYSAICRPACRGEARSRTTFMRWACCSLRWRAAGCRWPSLMTAWLSAGSSTWGAFRRWLAICHWPAR